MRLLLYGAAGVLGQRILADAIERGHAVTAAATDPSRIQELPGVTLVQADVLDAATTARLAEGHTAIVSAIGPGHAGDPSYRCQVASALLDAAQRGSARLLVVGETGVQPAVTLDFAATWSGAAQAGTDALAIYEAAPEGVSWTYVHAAGSLQSVERVAAAVLDEAESPHHEREAFAC